MTRLSLGGKTDITMTAPQSQPKPVDVDWGEKMRNDETLEGLTESFLRSSAVTVRNGNTDANVSQTRHTSNQDAEAQSKRKHHWLFSSRAFAGLTALGCLGLVVFWNAKTSLTQTKAAVRHRAAHTFFQCPRNKDGSLFDSGFNDNESRNYVPKSNDILNNLDEFVSTFRQQNYDAWKRTYEEIKHDLYDWKSRRIAPYLFDGASIYESACGVGLNLLMTLEIVLEVRRHRISNLTMYGNEFVPQSVKVANRLALRNDVFPPQTQLGQICQGDSMNLTAVPSDSMDVVFTGYITPLQNPLQLENIPNHKAFTKLYSTICSVTNNETLLAQAALLQHRQDDWHGQWVKEMIRIAKPGGPVIVESVSFPTCQHVSGWGGVDKSFWTDKSTHSRYGWEVDASSIEMEDSKKGSKKRYHVFMRKRKDV